MRARSYFFTFTFLSFNLASDSRSSTLYVLFFVSSLVYMGVALLQGSRGDMESPTPCKLHL